VEFACWGLNEIFRVNINVSKGTNPTREFAISRKYIIIKGRGLLLYTKGGGDCIGFPYNVNSLSGSLWRED
jgi:hypothetical protein